MSPHVSRFIALCTLGGLACSLAAAVFIVSMGPFALYAYRELARLLIAAGCLQFIAALAVRLWAYLKAARFDVVEALLWVCLLTCLAAGGLLIGSDRPWLSQNFIALSAVVLWTIPGQVATVAVWIARALRARRRGPRPDRSH